MRSPRLPVLGLLVAALLAAFAGAGGVCAQPAAPDWSAAETIEVDFSNFAFSPEKLQLKQGVVYRLHFVNKTTGGHDFTAKAFFADAQIDPEDQAALKDGVVSLSGQQTADVRLVPGKAGHYDAKCSHFMHATMGMKGEVEVQ
jgi:plastocyanin